MVAIILVNYQSYSDTVGCVESILLSPESGYRIFIVDNSSNKQQQSSFLQTLSLLSDRLVQESVEVNSEQDFDLQRAVSKIVVIDAKNRGFAAANNIVLKQIVKVEDYKFIWLLNNDTKIQPTTISKFIQSFELIRKVKKLGILGNVLVYEDNPSLIQGVGGIYSKFLGTTKHVLDGESLSNYDSSINYKIDYPIGASMLISLAFLKDVGLLNETYFLYFEELDWVIRGKKKSWVCDFAPNVYIYHKAGGSIGGKNKLKKRSSDVSDYFFYKNRLRFSYRYTPLYFPFVLLTVGASIFYRIIIGRSTFLKLFLGLNKKVV